MTAGPSEFFTRQIEANTETIAWAFGLVGPERLHASPPNLLGEWPAARQLFHLLYYEREVVLPSLSLWFGAPYPTFEGYDEAAAWANAPHTDVVLAELRSVRSAELALVRDSDSTLWGKVRHTPWGQRTFYWVVSKTLQHALEHTNNLLKIALLWEHYEARSRRPATQEAGEGTREIE